LPTRESDTQAEVQLKAALVASPVEGTSGIDVWCRQGVVVLAVEKTLGKETERLTDPCCKRTDVCMRTTLDLDDALIRKAKGRATDEGTTLTALIEAALRQYLVPAPPAGTTFRLKLLTKRGRPVPGINLADRDALYERMEGRG
jgi:Bacterial antitoxin of type II TA system, VapB